MTPADVKPTGLIAVALLRCVPVEESKMFELEKCKRDIQDIREQLTRAQTKSIENKRPR